MRLRRKDARSIGKRLFADKPPEHGRRFNPKGTWEMGLLDNVLGSAVPGGRLAKPLSIALLALLASRAAGGGGFGSNTGSGGGGFGTGSGGGLGGLLSGGLGGLLGGLAGSSPDRSSIPPDQAHAAVGGGL